MYLFVKQHSHRNLFWWNCLLGTSAILVGGMVYRVVVARLELLVTTPVSLPIPFESFPIEIDNWMGKDLAIPNTTREYMEKNFADDFLSRRYVNSTTGVWADVYVVYCSSRPGGIIGHQPLVCYPATGWIHDVTEKSQFVSRSGRQVPCLMHRFHRSAPSHERKVVLNFYILNGQVTTEENDFSGILGRRPNLAGNPARYVAQVQISSVLENSVRTAAKDMTNLILDFLPEENGEVIAAD